MVAYALISVLRRKRQGDFYEFQASLVCREFRDSQGETLSRKAKTNKQKIPVVDSS